MRFIRESMSGGETVATLKGEGRRVASLKRTPSMLMRTGHLYAALDSGHVACFKSDSGEELWKEKIDRDFYASPVILDELIFITNLQATTSVVKVSSTGAKLIAQNKLGDESLSSPTLCGNRIYLRFAKNGSPRQEFIAAIGE